VLFAPSVWVTTAEPGTAGRFSYGSCVPYRMSRKHQSGAVTWRGGRTEMKRLFLGLNAPPGFRFPHSLRAAKRRVRRAGGRAARYAAFAA